MKRSKTYSSLNNIVLFDILGVLQTKIIFQQNRFCPLSWEKKTVTLIDRQTSVLHCRLTNSVYLKVFTMRASKSESWLGKMKFSIMFLRFFFFLVFVCISLSSHFKIVFLVFFSFILFSNQNNFLSTLFLFISLSGVWKCMLEYIATFQRNRGSCIIWWIN